MCPYLGYAIRKMRVNASAVCDHFWSSVVYLFLNLLHSVQNYTKSQLNVHISLTLLCA